eukprot:479951-Pyramimonas_sp.AAC.1
MIDRCKRLRALPRDLTRRRAAQALARVIDELNQWAQSIPWRPRPRRPPSISQPHFHGHCAGFSRSSGPKFEKRRPGGIVRDSSRDRISAKSKRAS